jgi:predicted CXXCH cytochrome family protein
VGSDACRDCHSEIWEKYQSHPMSHSFARIDRATSIEDYTQHPGFAPPGNRKYQVERTDRGILHHEIRVDSVGEIIYDQSVPITHAVGSGKRGRGYVIQHDRLLFTSSISWYSDTGTWGLSPNYQPESHMRFERRVTDGCLACHSGVSNFTREEPDCFKEPAFLEEAIGCEKCHGPGRKHVAFKNSGDTGVDPIVNPGRLDMDRREAVCAQCHLRGETRILRTGRTAHDFRPGECLEDNWIVFVKADGPQITRSGRAATQAEQMVSSTCFQRSEGRLGCTSCHDPHSVPSPAIQDDFYRQKCMTCHTDRGCSLSLAEREASSHRNRCTACHMPAITAENVLHRSVADHRILRRTATADDDAEPSESIIFQFAKTPIPEHEIRRANALKLVADAIELNNQQDLAKAATPILKQLAEESPNDLELYVALGNCALIQDQPREAERLWSKVLQINPRHEPTVKALAVLYQDNYQLIPAERALKRFLALNPWHGSYYGRLAGTLMQRGDTNGAIAAAERGLVLNPSLWKLHEFLVNAYSNVGNRESADLHQKLLDRMRPAVVP